MDVRGGAARRCTRWTRPLGAGRYDRVCRAHTDDPAIAGQRQHALAQGTTAAHAPKSPRSDEVLDLFSEPMRTLADVQTQRVLFIKLFAEGNFSNAEGLLILRGLREQSIHIEKFGQARVVEGGHSYVRIMPGDEAATEVVRNSVFLSGSMLDAIGAGIDRDEQAGLEVPEDTRELIRRYCGREPYSLGDVIAGRAPSD